MIQQSTRDEPLHSSDSRYRKYRKKHLSIYITRECLGQGRRLPFGLWSCNMHTSLAFSELMQLQEQIGLKCLSLRKTHVKIVPEHTSILYHRSQRH